MQESEHDIFFANTISDVLYQLKTIPGLRIVGGCTGIMTLPEKSLSIRGIKELQLIDKRERYMDLGPAVTLSRLLEVGKNKLPSILYNAAAGISNSHIRNIATIGGNICKDGPKLTLYAPMLALDARLELHNEYEAYYIPITSFSGVPRNSMLIRIRIPIEEWDVAVFRRFGPAHVITENSASFAFLANTQKNTLTNLRIAFAGTVTFRSKELENSIIGTRLPLSEKNIDSLVADAARQFETAAPEKSSPPILKQQFLNLVHYSLEQLT
ncbi:MAG: FAD binding domain-containing protein [Treponema sp.]|jgi:CO/xanthine dehydrogenase FAD-binding subunit|nr:FAD binding domain-containing protein [Treponema sp.]